MSHRTCTRSPRAASAVAPAASAPLTHSLGFRTPGRFWTGVGARPRCRAVTSPSGPRLNTAGDVPAPNAERSMRKAYVIAVGVEANTLAHRRDRHLPANRELPPADDDLDAGPEHRPGALEKEGDRRQAHTLETLARAFATPMDRKEIHLAATSIDDVLN
jgi:hypothetical protein